MFAAIALACKDALVLVTEQLPANVFDKKWIFIRPVTGGCELSPFHHNMLHCWVIPMTYKFRWICLSLHNV